MCFRSFLFAAFLSLSWPLLHGQELPERNRPPEAPAPPERFGDFLDEEADAGREGVRFRRLNAPVLFSNFFLKTNEAVRDLIVIGGDAEIEGIVEGTLFLIGGRARISGTVEGETIVILGGAEITEEARLEREVMLIGGPFSISEGAELLREPMEYPFGDVARKMDWFKQWLFEGLFYGRLLPLGVNWPWVVAGIFAFIYLGLLLVFPGAVKGTVDAIEQRPVTSMAVGMLTLVLFAPLVFLLIVSVVGIIVVPFLKLAFVLLALFGKAGLICFLGRSAGRSVRAGFFERMLPGFLAGLVLITVAYMLPVLGVLAWAVGSVFGLGAAAVALAGTFQREETGPPAPVRVGPVPVPGTAASGLGEGAATAAMPQTVSSPADTLFLPRAGFWRRLGAALLDWVLLLITTIWVQEYVLLLAVAYFVGMWTWRGTTIGGIVLGLKLVSTNGSRPNFVVALVRSLSSVFSAICGFLGFFWAGWDREKQSWHDKIAGTVVVRMPRDLALV